MKLFLSNSSKRKVYKKRYVGLNLKEIRTNSKKVAAFRVALQVFSPTS